MIVLFVSIITGLVVLSASVQYGKNDIGASAAVRYYAKQTVQFSMASKALLAAISSIDKDSASWIHARVALKNCRLRYKSISFFTSYFFRSETAMYNAAPKYEVEEPELELVEPMGLQQIEVLLFEDNVFERKAELLEQISAFDSSVGDLKTLLYQFEASDAQVLESLKLEMIRVITLYISGYDAPLLKSGISESLESSMSMEMVLQPYFQKNPNDSKALASTLHNSISYLKAHQEFDDFNRMEYLVSFALPIQEQLSAYTTALGLTLNTSDYLDSRQANLFRPGFLKTWDSIEPRKRKELAALGRTLFFDKRLSGNGKVSCASCHVPERYFTDGKVKSPSLNKDSVLKRNTPSLLYAGLQHGQFWDGRAKTVKAQIRDVLFNPLEMDGSEVAIRKLFSQGSEKDPLDEISTALSAFVSSLQPMNSPFDQYMAGNKKALTEIQIQGFNLFMGKAQCGTCHFAPLFNSLVPPFYDISELEILGTTQTDDLLHPQYDSDQGRNNLYKIQYYQQAFKTPTVRNAEKTGPYMHNGAFKTLERVIEFYNQGGAAGLGLKTPNQTLSSRPLSLSKAESEALIQFIHSLTDTNLQDITLTK
jgi:cytochrome c peroxidase